MVTQTNFTPRGRGLMNRALVFGAALVAAALMAVAALSGFGTSTAYGSSPAVVINDFGCILLDGDGQMAWTSSSHAVITNSENGNRVLKCSAKGLDNSTGKATHFDSKDTGYLCMAYGVITADWRNVVSKSGNSTLTCLVKK